MKNLSIILAGLALLIAVGALVLGFNHQTAGSTVSYGNTTTAIPEPGGTALVDGQIAPNPSTSDYIVARVYAAVQMLGLWDNTSVPVHIQAVRMAMTNATDTPCVLQNPFTASSTILSTSFTPSLIGGTLTMTLADAYIPNATTTVIQQFSSSVANTAFVSNGAATTTTFGGTVLPTVPASGYVTYGTNASSSAEFAGFCSAVFQTIN